MNSKLNRHIKDRYTYYILFVLFVIIGAVYVMATEKHHLLFLFSDNRTPWLDVFFIQITRGSEWYGYLLFFIILLFTDRIKAGFLAFTALFAAIGALTFKWLFSRPRPALHLQGTDLLEMFVRVQDISMHTGLTSFPSGHALAGFALCTYLTMISPPRQYLGFLFFMLALAIGLSRVYLGHHFFEDIIAGAVVGTVAGYASWLVYRGYIKKRKGNILG